MVIVFNSHDAEVLAETLSVGLRHLQERLALLAQLIVQQLNVAKQLVLEVAQVLSIGRRGLEHPAGRHLARTAGKNTRVRECGRNGDSNLACPRPSV